MQKLILLLVLISLNVISAQTKKKQILLMGTFHFENPGLDVAKVNTFDVMSGKSQKELENITNKIKTFGPDKIFVEWNYKKQNKLDKFYAKNTDSLLKKDTDEIVQLALRTAKKLGHNKLYGIDYSDVNFPYDSLVTEMKNSDQLDLFQKSMDEITAYEKSENLKIKKYSLTQLLLDCNTKESNDKNIQWYFEIANRTGKTERFVGAFLVSEWYRRNLYMFSLIQRLIESKDDKVMVLLGAGHIAMLREFVKHDPNFEIIELSTVLK